MSRWHLSRVVAALTVACVGCSRGNAPAPQQPPTPPRYFDMEQGGCLAPGQHDFSAPNAEVERLRGNAADWGGINVHISDGKRAVAGIQVVVAHESRTVNSEPTDEWGNVHFIGLAAGDYELTFLYGGATAGHKTITVTAGNTVVDDEVLPLANLHPVPRCA